MEQTNYCKKKWVLGKKVKCSDCGGYYRLGFVHSEYQDDYYCNYCPGTGHYCKLVQPIKINQRCLCNIDSDMYHIMNDNMTVLKTSRRINYKKII
jgi:hypothetical protein